jgi:hypothetical protein
MALIRTKHWATREFNAHLMAHAHHAFEWGKNDCCLYAANAIQCFTGVDIAADFRGLYSNQISAMAAIKAVTGGSTVADAAAWCAAKHGLVEYAHPRQAQRGDLVVMRQNAEDPDERLMAGVVHLSGRDLVTVGERGLMRISILNVVRAWKV